ncbi:MAG TPA: glycosyltransferase [Burkholderiaceae bacterium]|nr:glycosyltransferase [Burkholderiaceae bacterium]
MGTSLPFFSVVLPTHQRPLLFERALRSLRQQSFQDFETLVVADVWDKDTAIVAAEQLGPNDVFLKRAGAPGPSASRNIGLELARGEWVVFLDDDDTFAPHHLQTLHGQAQRAESVALFSDCTVVTEDRTQAGVPSLSRDPLGLISNDVNAVWIKNFIPAHALAYRRSAIAACLFDAHLASLEDWDFLLAVCSRGMPKPYAGGGAVVHKDYANPGISRGGQDNANNSIVVLDYLHIYRRWPAPTPALKAQRQALIKSVGLDLPIGWF